MKLFKLNSNKLVNVPITKYLIDWDKKKVSKPQFAVKSFLKKYWECEYVLEEFLIPGSRLRIDFLNTTSKVSIEVSPKSSHSFNPFFHGSRNTGFLESVKRDESKSLWAEQNGFLHIELGDEELKNLTKEMFKEKGLEL